MSVPVLTGGYIRTFHGIHDEFVRLEDYQAAMKPALPEGYRVDGDDGAILKDYGGAHVASKNEYDEVTIYRTYLTKGDVFALAAFLGGAR